MTSKDKKSSQGQSQRRQFIRSAVRAAGTAALLLSSAGRETMARSLALDPSDIEAARRAQREQKARPGDETAEALQSGTRVAEGCPSCAGSCTGCGGWCTGCDGCQGCKGTCIGCSGINL